MSRTTILTLAALTLMSTWLVLLHCRPEPTRTVRGSVVRVDGRTLYLISIRCEPADGEPGPAPGERVQVTGVEQDRRSR